MHANIIAAARRLSDTELLRRLGDLAGRERLATVELIAHVAELDRRKLYREQGYGSLFSYCTDALRLSEGPVARAWFDHQIPITFHGTFAPGKSAG